MIAENTANIEYQESFIEIIFKNPVDVINSKGLYDMQYGNAPSPFSGVYRVLEIKHNWSNGMYKATLSAIRVAAQTGTTGPTGMCCQLNSVVLLRNSQVLLNLQGVHSKCQLKVRAQQWQVQAAV